MIGPARADRGLVIFHFWPSLAWGRRLTLSLLLLAAALAIQAAAYLAGFGALLIFALGAPPLLLGNLLLLVKGYDNRVDFKRFDPHASWQPVKRERLQQLKQMDKAIGKWDVSLLDASNVIGMIMLLLLMVALSALFWLLPGLPRVLVLDAALLALPHWLTGIRRILRFPKLLVKVDAMTALLDTVASQTKDDKLELLMLLKGGERKLPEDIKFRLSFPEQDPEFLGLYGQVVTNDVQGKSYPYFYTVMVAKRGYGLGPAFAQYQPPAGITKELGGEGEVEFIVIRQTTSKTSGYHTNPPAAVSVFMAGHSLAQKLAAR